MKIIILNICQVQKCLIPGFEHYDHGIGIVEIYLVNFHFLSFTIAIVLLNMYIIICDIFSLDITVLVFLIYKAAKD